MNELANTTTELAKLDSLADEARFYSNAMANNIIQLGRVFTEAKALLKHGQWGEWVDKNASMSARSAENVMGIYRRFGGREEFEGLKKTQLFRMLSLPEGTEEAFIRENNVHEMSTRQLEEAVKKAREEALADAAKQHQQDEEAIGEYRKQVDSLRKEIENINNQPVQIPQAAKDEIDRLKAQCQESMDNLIDANKRLAKLHNDYQIQGELMDETQQSLAKAQKDLLDIKSSMARGDAERTPSDVLDIDAFANAVQAFVGKCARMPHMQKQFAGMTLRERNDYEEYLCTVESWCRDSRKAMNVSVVEA